MSPELQAKIYAAAPILYQEKDLPMSHTCMCWGIDCGDGWFDLLLELSQKLEAYNQGNPDPVVAVQVKEKYGTLRFYTRGVDEYADSLIEAAEHRSAVTCDTCGEPGTLRGGGWLYTACGAHTK